MIRVALPNIDAPTTVMQQPVDPAAPQVHQVDKCANMLCSNRPGEGSFTVFSMLLERHPIALALCAPCGETLRKRAKW